MHTTVLAICEGRLLATQPNFNPLKLSSVSRTSERNRKDTHPVFIGDGGDLSVRYVMDAALVVAQTDGAG